MYHFFTGTKRVCQERGVYITKMNKTDMMAALNKFTDFQNSVPLLVERIQAMDDRYEVIFLPKFHCELNPVSTIAALMPFVSCDCTPECACCVDVAVAALVVAD